MTKQLIHFALFALMSTGAIAYPSNERFETILQNAKQLSIKAGATGSYAVEASRGLSVTFRSNVENSSVKIECALYLNLDHSTAVAYFRPLHNPHTTNFLGGVYLRTIKEVPLTLALNSPLGGRSQLHTPCLEVGENPSGGPGICLKWGFPDMWINHSWASFDVLGDRTSIACYKENRDPKGQTELSAEEFLGATASFLSVQ